jgi:RHS repeat-associated protein
VTTSYLQDAAGGLPVALQEKTGSNTNSYLFELGSTTPLYQQQSQPGGATVWYHRDGLGSVRTLTDNSANVKNSYNYNAFGTLTQQSGTVSNTHLYAGEQIDPSGMYYNRNRYYNTGTGRFTQQDSYGGNAYSPVSQNRFIYGGDNPIAYTDPSGYYYDEGEKINGGQKVVVGTKSMGDPANWAAGGGDSSWGSSTTQTDTDNVSGTNTPWGTVSKWNTFKNGMPLVEFPTSRKQLLFTNQYLSQFDQSWANLPLPLKDHQLDGIYDTIASNGCTITSVAMLRNFVEGVTGYTPHANFNIDQFKAAYHPTQISFDASLLSNKANLSKIEDAINKNQAVLVSINFPVDKDSIPVSVLGHPTDRDNTSNHGKDLGHKDYGPPNSDGQYIFTWASHTFVATGITTDGQIIIYDPAARDALPNNQYVTIDKYFGKGVTIASAFTIGQRHQ